MNSAAKEKNRRFASISPASVTGTAFVPRGASYVRLQQDSTGVAYHATFEPGAYDPTGAQGNLDYMRSSGYNTVRVFIDPGPPSER